MNRKAYYIIILTLITGSLVISFFFIPSFEQVSLMFFYDKRFSEAYSRYVQLYNQGLPVQEVDLQHSEARAQLRQLYAKGNQSQSVALTLALLELEFAKPLNAMEILQKFVSTHKKNYDLWKYMADFYELLMQPYNRLLSLKSAYALKPTQKNLEEQYVLYLYYNDVSNEIRALREIIDHYTPMEDQYTTLAYLYASEAEDKKALDIIHLMLAKNKLSNLHLDSIEFAINILGMHHLNKEAFQLAVDYLKEHNNAETGAHLAYDMLTLKMGDAGLFLLDQLTPLDQQMDEPFDVRVDILVEEKKLEEAFELERKRYLAGHTARNIIENLLSLALETKQYLFAERLIRVHGPILHISEPLAIGIIQKSIELNKPGLAKALELSLGPAYLKEHPFIAFILPIATKPKSDQDEEFIGAFDNFKSFDNTEKAILAQLFYTKGYLALSQRVLKSIDTLAGIDLDLLYYTALLYEQLNLVNRGLELVESERSWQKDSVMLEKAWLLLSAAAGKTAEVLQGLGKYKTFNEDDLITIFFAASDYHHYELTLKLAQMINLRFPSLKNQKYLAEAYILNHKPLLALDIIEKLRAAKINVSDIYITALAEASKKYPAYRPKLREAVLEMLAKRPVSKKDERDFGYLLLEYGFKRDAAIIFLELAGSLPFKNADVQSLLAIWGEKPPLEGIAWIYNRAKKSQGSEKGAWLKYLVDVKQPQAVLTLVSWDELHYTKIADAYLEALLQLKDDITIGKVIAGIFHWENNVKRLKELGKIAKDVEQNKIAEQVYSKAYQIQPNDKDIIRQLGLITSALGKFKASKAFIEAYYCFEPWGDYLINYYYGQILKFKNKERQADQVFKLALCQLAFETKKDIYTRMTEAQLLYLTKNYDEAITLYTKLLDSEPSNLSLRADFGNMLLDLQHYQSAQAILFASCIPYKKSELTKTQQVKSERALAIAQARYSKEKKDFQLATYQANDLVNSYPNSPEVLQHKANVENDIGRWRRAIAFVDMAQALDPFNESYQKAKKDIFRSHRAAQMIGAEYRVTTNVLTGIAEIDHFGRLQLSTNLYPYTKLIYKKNLTNFLYKLLSILQETLLILRDCVIEKN